MGTTLTGTTPQDTYDSLIKVTDNGPISGTLKALSDGLGNDSTLSLSTTAASIAGTLAVAGNATFDTSTLFVDAANNRVGVGTITPTYKLQVLGASPAIAIERTTGDQPKIAFAASSSEYAYIIANAANGQNQFSIGPEVGWGGSHVFITNTVERVRVTDNGLTFNGDTAAANALDDYEEGTFTPTAFGATTAGTTTYNGQNGY